MKAHQILIVTLLCLPLWACPTGQAVKTMTLQPALQNSHLFQKTNDAEYSCWPFTCFNTQGTLCPLEVNSQTSVQVGFDYYLDNGTQPCNCWHYNDCVWRGFVSFPLTNLQGKNVISAQLKWNGRGVCVKRLYTATAPPNIFALSPSQEHINAWPPGSSGPGEVQVGGTVHDWVQNNLPNHGFLFVGPSENFPNYLQKEGEGEIGPANAGTSDCLSSVHGISLEVNYTD